MFFFSKFEKKVKKNKDEMFQKKLPSQVPKQKVFFFLTLHMDLRSQSYSYSGWNPYELYFVKI